MRKKILLAGLVAVIIFGAFQTGMAVGVMKKTVSELTVEKDRKKGRLTAVVPMEYGKLVSVLKGKGKDLLWFEDDEGTLRRIPLNLSTTEEHRVIYIQRMGLRKMVEEKRKVVE